MVNEKREGFEIDVQKLMLAYLSKWWVILFSTIMGTLAALVITVNFITPLYRASVTVYVNSTKAEEQINFVSNSNLVTAQRLVNTYVNIIESDTVLTKVAEAARLDISADAIRAVMSATQVDNTELFKVFITHDDPEMAATIANAIAEVAPGEIEKIVEGSSTKIIDYAKVPKTPFSPDVTKNSAIGGMIGFALALVFVTVHFLMDVRIKEEEDLTALFEIPVLGQIPDFVTTDAKRRNTYGSTAEKNSETNKKEGEA